MLHVPPAYVTELCMAKGFCKDCVDSAPPTSRWLHIDFLYCLVSILCKSDCSGELGVQLCSWTSGVIMKSTVLHLTHQRSVELIQMSRRQQNSLSCFPDCSISTAISACQMERCLFSPHTVLALQGGFGMIWRVCKGREGEMATLACWINWILDICSYIHYSCICR